MPEFRLDHVAIAVRSIKPAIKLFRDALGGEYLMGGDDDTWTWLQLKYPGGGKVELLEPNPQRGAEGFLARFLDKRGEGLHHVTFKTDDLKGAIDHITHLGYELVDVNLQNPNWKEAFFRPSGAHGVLIQVAESSHTDEEVSSFAHPSNLEELLD